MVLFPACKGPTILHHPACYSTLGSIHPLPSYSATHPRAGTCERLPERIRMHFGMRPLHNTTTLKIGSKTYDTTNNTARMPKITPSQQHISYSKLLYILPNPIRSYTVHLTSYILRSTSYFPTYLSRSYFLLATFYPTIPDISVDPEQRPLLLPHLPSILLARNLAPIFATPPFNLCSSHSGSTILTFLTFVLSVLDT